MSAKDRRELRARVRARDGAEADICPWCETPFAAVKPRIGRSGGVPFEVRATFEHIIAKRDGGLLTLANVVLVCVWCNETREHLHHRGVQDEQRLIQELVTAEARRQAERARRRELAFAATGAGWGRAQTALIEEAR